MYIHCGTNNTQRTSFLGRRLTMQNIVLLKQFEYLSIFHYLLGADSSTSVHYFQN